MMSTQEYREAFDQALEANTGRVSQFFTMYQDFQNSVAMWRDPAYVIVSLAEEAMEYQMATKLAKQEFRGDDLSQEAREKRFTDVEKELGDVFFFWLANCKHWGLDPVKVIQHNVHKLADRMNRGVIKGDGNAR